MFLDPNAKENTIRNEVSCSGIGLHSGKTIHLRLLPAPEESGVIFIRRDLGGILIPADHSHIVSTYLSTTIGVEGASVQTIEHLMAAVYAMGIHNLIVELDGPEVPVMDGSSEPFIALLSKAGVLCQDKPRTFMEIMKEVTVSDNERRVTIHPSSSFEIEYKIAYSHPVISKQSYHYRHSPLAFKKEIASARTFGFLKDVQSLQEQGLARGGSLENAVVIGDDGVLNKQGLRFSDEFVRHKILDLIGDLSLIGMPILGRVEATCSGHSLHAELIEEVLENKNAWRIVTAPSLVKERPVYPAYQGMSLPLPTI
ncbi:MAG: UDP-3-O-acyl-N-acetylglucosamine deacetylase [Nitrospira sp.]|nr:UDP-3-O-acyl-N-acetylglucosamine deacetylase [Candidatus Manganitrophaceae bacterium]